MTAPTLSVVMPNYNHARFIPDALGAILGQSYRPKEILIVDDGSTDNSVEVLERMRQQAPDLITVHQHERNQGLMRTLHELTMMATGDYMFVPAFDDRVLPGFFARSMTLLARHPSAGVCSTLSRVMNEAGEDQGLVTMPVVTPQDSFLNPQAARQALQRHGNWFMGNTTIFRRSALIGVGGYRPELGPYCDGFASLAIALSHGACFVPEPLAVWRRMEGTFSQRASTDVDRTLAMLDEAERLMTTTFREQFPPELVGDWKRRMYFGAAAAIAVAPAEDAMTQMQRLVPSTTATDRAFHAIARLMPTLGRRLAKPYLFAKLRRGHLWNALADRAVLAARSLRVDRVETGGEAGQ